jgi:hypothetical protein
MNRVRRGRVLVEAVLAGCSGLFLVVTVVWTSWIEGMFDYDPDRHSGSLERMLVTALLVATVVFGLLARSEWIRSGVAAEELERKGV